MKQFKVLDYDIIYLSYDEPNAEENYADLLTKAPWAKRIHGVEGSDASHKACANIAETKRFITIDGDNQIDEQFLNQTINFQDGVDLSRHVVSWTADNIINGLRYGNGGIKCWDRETVLKMKTHENADPDNIAAGIDFCWDLEYIQINSLMSTVYNNATPHQAWRAGFREGVKMSLIEGMKPAKNELIGNHWKNLERLYIWTMAGADVENGLWAIHGAREGLYKTMCTDWDYVNVRDFEYLNKLWKEKVQDESDLLEACQDYGERLKVQLDIPIAVTPLDAQQSKFFKSTYRNPPRPEHPYIRTTTTQFNTFSSNFIPNKKVEYDIVMISYDEANADENFDKLKTRFPRAQRIHGVKGIHQAHIAAANICSTEMFWIVDGDAVIADDFNFDYEVEDSRAVHVWRSQNPINDLVYGYGGVKLFPTQMTRDMDTSRPDMTTSISDRFKKMEGISCITAFNSSEFSTWRGAFRECAKLSSKVIDRQKENETNERLKTWTTVGHDRPFGKYALAGATAGMEFGLSSGADLRLINDFNWLYEQFTETTDTTEEWQKLYRDADTVTTKPVDIAPVEIQEDTGWKQTVPYKEDEPLPPRDTFIVDLLDRFEILYGDKVTNIRRFYNDGHMLDILKIIGDEDLRKFVEERNYHSLFRYLENKGIQDIEDIRKMYIEKNVHSLFRLLGKDHEELRKAVTEDNVHSLFRLVGDEHEDLRKTVVEENLHSLFRLLGDEHEELRKVVTEDNLHSLFRLLGPSHDNLRTAMIDKNLHGLFRILGNDYEDLRKATLEKNFHGLFRLLGDEYEDLRKAVTEKNVHSLFRLINESDTTDDLRKALVESNEMSLFRLIEDKDNIVEDIKKAGFYKNMWSVKRIEPSVTDEVNLTMDNNRHALWRVLDKHTGSAFVKPLEILDKHKIEYDKDVMSRGQLKSKKWLVDELTKLNLPLGTIFLCAGWYASIVPLMQEAKLDFEKIRSFDIDPEAWKIAETFNADLVNEGWQFKASTQDIMHIDYIEHNYNTEKLDGAIIPLTDMPHTIVNTSCEHIDNFKDWYNLLPESRLIILQSNNYFAIKEHVNCSNNLKEFSSSTPMQKVLYEGELDLGQYTRYMKIGYK